MSYQALKWWLGWVDSNLGMAESKPAVVAQTPYALPNVRPQRHSMFVRLCNHPAGARVAHRDRGLNVKVVFEGRSHTWAATSRKRRLSEEARWALERRLRPA
jgi:hypothetical protein